MNSFIWRKKNITGGGNVDTTNLVTTNTNQTISGAKTFTIIPQSSVSPTNANDLVNKTYVDNAIQNVSGTTPWTKIGFIQSSIVQPNQNNTSQVIDFTNYELSNGIFSFSLKIGVNGHDLTCSIPNLQITDNISYSVCSNIITIKSPNDIDKFFDLMIERTTNHQIKLWIYDVKNNGFTITYWGVLVRREGDLVSYN